MPTRKEYRRRRSPNPVKAIKQGAMKVERPARTRDRVKAREESRKRAHKASVRKVKQTVQTGVEMLKEAMQSTPRRRR